MAFIRVNNYQREAVALPAPLWEGDVTVAPNVRLLALTVHGAHGWPASIDRSLRVIGRFRSDWPCDAAPGMTSTYDAVVEPELARDLLRAKQYHNIHLGDNDLLLRGLRETAGREAVKEPSGGTDDECDYDTDVSEDEE